VYGHWTATSNICLDENICLNITSVLEIPVAWQLLNEPKSGTLKKHVYQRFEIVFLYVKYKIEGLHM